MNDNQTPTGIKQLIQGMMPEGAGVVEGTVTKESPLEITLINDSKMKLSRNSLVLPEWLTDWKKKADIVLADGSIDSKTGKEPGVGSHAGHIAGDGSHVHELKTFNIYKANITVYNHLKVGDMVYLLSFNEGKQYYILDRKG